MQTNSMTTVNYLISHLMTLKITYLKSTSQLISEEDAVTKKDGFRTLKKLTEEKVNDTDLGLDYNNMHSHHDQLVKIYSKAANPKEMTFTEYCAFI